MSTSASYRWTQQSRVGVSDPIEIIEDKYGWKTMITEQKI